MVTSIIKKSLNNDNYRTLILLKANHNFIKNYTKLGVVFYRYNKIIKEEEENIRFEELEGLMDEIRKLKGKQGFKLIFNDVKNIMLEKIRTIHIEKIRKNNRVSNKVNKYFKIFLNFIYFYLKYFTLKPKQFHFSLKI